jgi:hypothetical protein
MTGKDAKILPTVPKAACIRRSHYGNKNRQKTHYMPTVAAGAIRAQINGMMIAPTVVNRINKNHTN